MNSAASSAPEARSTPSYSDPTPNPFIIISDRASRLMLIVLVSCALTVALVRLFLVWIDVAPGRRNGARRPKPRGGHDHCLAHRNWIRTLCR
jgi:hypothetical protein